MRDMEEVVPGVHRVVVRFGGIPYVNAVLVEGEGEGDEGDDGGGGGVAIVDTGMPKRADRIFAALARIGHRPSAVRRIVVTHHHIDHTGSVRSLAAATGAPVFVHRADAAIVLGQAPAPPANRETISGRIMGPIIGRLQPKYHPPPAVTEMSDREVLAIAGGTRVVHTPGHTAGHVSLLIPAKRLLIAGDAAANIGGRLRPPVGTFTEDRGAALQSIRRLAELDFDTACFGHGAVLRGSANTAFRRLVERVASASPGQLPGW